MTEFKLDKLHISEAAVTFGQTAVRLTGCRDEIVNICNDLRYQPELEKVEDALRKASVDADECINALRRMQDTLNNGMDAYMYCERGICRRYEEN